MQFKTKHSIVTAFIAGLCACMASCNKMVTIDEPINSVTSVQVFSTDAQAASAVAGIYTQMINGTARTNSATSVFSNGLTTLTGAFSSDEFITLSPPGTSAWSFSANRLLRDEPYTNTLWTTAYSVIYKCNAVIEGIAGSESGALSQKARAEFTGEARFIRAFSYFYLTNLFGDVPLALTIDFNKTRLLPRAAQSKVYEQIINDLKEAQAVLPDDYAATAGERVRVSKWAATAMLARVYLYAGDPTNAVAQASAVIGHTALFELPANLASVFLKDSREAIWQLKQTTSVSGMGTATPEGREFLPSPLRTGSPSYILSNEQLSVFETGDKRRYAAWIDSTNNSQFGPVGMYYFPYKYKTGRHNLVVNGVATEYYMVLRLAEMYLVRAEALANGSGGGLSAAINDLNALRQRAGVALLPASLNATQVKEAVAVERRRELFAEWGHRWLDLKRTGRAHDVLSVIPRKQPWQGDYQLLYPIPPGEILNDYNLVQNPGY